MSEMLRRRAPVLKLLLNSAATMHRYVLIWRSFHCFIHGVLHFSSDVELFVSRHFDFSVQINICWM